MEWVDKLNSDKTLLIERRDALKSFLSQTYYPDTQINSRLIQSYSKRLSLWEAEITLIEDSIKEIENDNFLRADINKYKFL